MTTPDDALIAAVRAAVTDWSMDTPASYARRTPEEELQYFIWVEIKRHVEHALSQGAA